MAIAALEAGKHVLLEKPMATTAEDCRRIVEAVERTGKLLSVGFELRLSIQWGRIKQLIEEGAIGRPRYVNIGLFRHPYRQGAAGWRYAREQVGSWILEEPVHFYDFAMWYLAGSATRSRSARIGTARGRGRHVRQLHLDHPLRGRRLRHDHAVAARASATTSWSRWPAPRAASAATWSGADAASETPAFELLVGPAGMDPPRRVELAGNSGEVFELEEEIRLTTASLRRRPHAGRRARGGRSR